MLCLVHVGIDRRRLADVADTALTASSFPYKGVEHVVHAESHAPVKLHRGSVGFGHGERKRVAMLPAQRGRGGAEQGVSQAATALLGRQANLRDVRSEEHTSELQSRFDLVCRL